MAKSAERAYNHIKEGILLGRYRSGERLPEVAIAEELIISRTPVRDALHRLHSEGFIEIKPNSGARVVSLSKTELFEITQMRVLLEGFAAELAAAKISSATVVALDGLCDEMETYLQADNRHDLDAFSRKNLEFHQRVVQAAENSRLAAAVEPLWAFPLMVRKFALFDQQRIKRSMDHHREIVDALRAGDANWAGSIMRTHITASQAYDVLLSGGNH